MEAKQNGDGCLAAATATATATTTANDDDDEQRKVEVMRAFVEKQDPTAKDVDDLTIRRFLRARGLDVDKGSALLLKYLSWRRSFVPNSCISPTEALLSTLLTKYVQGKVPVVHQSVVSNICIFRRFG
ncbi:hypothetical protein Dimus_015403 [Dionaea muscipula]